MAGQEQAGRKKQAVIAAAALGFVGGLVVAAVAARLCGHYVCRERKAQSQCPTTQDEQLAGGDGHPLSHEEGMIEVICVKTTVEEGQPLTEDNLEITRIPERLVPTEFMDDIARAGELKVLLDLKVTQDIAPGRIVRYSYFSAGPIRPGTPVLPKKGFRVMPLDVDEKTCPANVAVGDYVDLMTTGDFDGKLKTMPVMEKVLVKALNGTSTPGSPGRRIEQVGLEVKKEDAVKVKTFLAARPGSIELWLRAADEEPGFRGFSPVLEAELKKKGIEFPKGLD